LEELVGKGQQLPQKTGETFVQEGEHHKQNNYYHSRKVSVGVSLTHLSARPLRFPAAFLMQANSSALALLVQVGLAKDMSEAEANRKYSIYQYLCSILELITTASKYPTHQ